MPIAEAPQTEPPAMLVTGNAVTFSWIGADTGGIHSDIRRWEGGAWTPPTILPLPPRNPRAQTLLPAPAGGVYLFWIDQDANQQTQLYHAWITNDKRVERGPTQISETAAVFQYAAANDGAGRGWALWSGGDVAFPTLYLSAVDDAGRPLPPTQIAENARDPALVSLNDGTLLALWTAEDQLVVARFSNGVLLQTRRVTAVPYRASGDRLLTTSAGADSDRVVFFWNIARADGQLETWWTHGGLDGGAWSQPTRLEALRLVGAARVQTPSLLAAGMQNTTLTLLTRRGDDLVATTRIADGVLLLRPPAVAPYLDDAAVAWSAGRLDQPAQLSWGLINRLE